MPRTLDMILESRELAIDELAAAAGLEAERMQAIATGRWTPSPDERTRIAAALELSIEDVSWGHTMNPRNVRYRRFGLPKTFGEE